MKRERRTKRDIENMRHECTMYLLQYKLDPHKAFEAMVKDCLISGQSIPYYIKGIKDFIRVSEELKVKLSRTEKEEEKEQKENPIDKLKKITPEQYKAEIMPIFKQQTDKEIKISLVNLWQCIDGNCFKSITNQDIRYYQELNIV
ncbi:hypothetical protein [Paenibacillus naphthalenovorans]|uniref:Uncharacterized protein n=1 Tax=Paenibacillus naphthalenovorans TaxID=162209 RepID=A0A0U2IM91_9BACL|nr:hypothetical protein [Paenibacillus naphthalenovorans]ALS22267.1 hypothetical protein IJ22_18930 [Paenibacillus naphthalenovorans]